MVGRRRRRRCQSGCCWSCGVCGSSIILVVFCYSYPSVAAVADADAAPLPGAADAVSVVAARDTAITGVVHRDVDGSLPNGFGEALSVGATPIREAATARSSVLVALQTARHNRISTRWRRPDLKNKES